MNILAIGCHPDDIELGCFGVAALHHNRGDNIFGIVMTNGELGGDPVERKKESEASAKLIDMKLFFGNFPDGKITDCSETVDFIENIINHNSIDIVYTHTIHDRHQDHRNVARASISAARFVNEVYCYESPSTLTLFSPQVFVDISSTIWIKKEVLSLQKTQINRYYMEIESSLGLAKYRAFQSGKKSEFCEAFEVVRIFRK